MGFMNREYLQKQFKKATNKRKQTIGLRSSIKALQVKNIK